MRKIGTACVSSIGLLLMAGCGPSLNTIRRAVASSKHERIAVLPFSSPRAGTNAGEEAADLLSQELEDMGFVLMRPEETSNVAIYSVTARMTDVESGMILWVGSGSGRTEGSTVQDAAEDVVDTMARELGRKFVEKHL